MVDVILIYLLLRTWVVLTLFEDVELAEAMMLLLAANCFRSLNFMYSFWFILDCALFLRMKSLEWTGKSLKILPFSWYPLKVLITVV